MAARTAGSASPQRLAVQTAGLRRSSAGPSGSGVHARQHLVGRGRGDERGSGSCRIGAGGADDFGEDGEAPVVGRTDQNQLIHEFCTAPVQQRQGDAVCRERLFPVTEVVAGEQSAGAVGEKVEVNLVSRALELFCVLFLKLRAQSGEKFMQFRRVAGDVQLRVAGETVERGVRAPFRQRTGCVDISGRDQPVDHAAANRFRRLPGGTAAENHHRIAFRPLELDRPFLGDVGGGRGLRHGLHRGGFRRFRRGSGRCILRLGGGGGVDGVDGGTAGKQHRGCDGKQGGKCCFHDFLRKKNSFFHTIPPLCRFGKSGGWFFREFPQSIRQNRRKW